MNTTISFLLLLLALVLGTSPRALYQPPSSSVASIESEDTVRFEASNEILALRVACIDAPEMSQQPCGQTSRQRLQQLLSLRKRVIVVPVGRDRHGRTGAKVFTGNLSVNVAIVPEGQAVVYRQYLKNYPDLEATFFKAEQSAQSRKLGFWSQPSPVMAWHFQRLQRNVPLPSGTQNVPRHLAQPKFLELAAYVKSYCNCLDFLRQTQIQWCLTRTLAILSG